MPPSAAEVSVSEVLRKSYPELARQAEEPTSLLFPPLLRLESVRKPHALSHKMCAKYVLRKVQVGLQRLAPVRSVFKHRGRPLVGDLALFKSAIEHRVISDLPVNDLIDPGKLSRD